ncbi:MAG: 50S ribosomal protein L29 [Flammeovirgaceae bacterium]|nr:50S ribosomal protein L29 [Flammeovirgaceae bacterium]MDW8287020.1 50S ribosomal protein L29 [Flammeovirgaceae bacterium]
MDNKELKKLSVEELKKELVNTENTLRKLLFSHAISPLRQTSQLRALKKTVARIKTELHARTLQELDKKVKEGALTYENAYEVLHKQDLPTPYKKKNVIKALAKAMSN